MKYLEINVKTVSAGVKISMEGKIYHISVKIIINKYLTKLIIIVTLHIYEKVRKEVTELRLILQTENQMVMCDVIKVVFTMCSH